MARMARTRAFLPALLGLAVLAAAATPASAYRNLTHPDPVRAFKKHPFVRTHPFAHTSTFSDSFATAWGCTERTSDLPPAISSNAPQVKVIYVYPHDLSDNFSIYKDLIQADAAAVRSRFANPVTNDVSAVDVKTMKEVARIPVGFVPKRNTTGILQ